MEPVPISNQYKDKNAEGPAEAYTVRAIIHAKDKERKASSKHPPHVDAWAIPYGQCVNGVLWWGNIVVDISRPQVLPIF